jgi:hypothetical protein
MSSCKAKHSHYAHLTVIATFGDVIQHNDKQGLTHSSCILLYFAIIVVVGYELHRYITANVLTYKVCVRGSPQTVTMVHALVERIQVTELLLV